MNVSAETLKQIMTGPGQIPVADYDAAAQAAEELGKRIDDILIFRGLATQEAIGRLVAEYYKVPFVDVAHLPTPDEALPQIPEKMARHYRIAPLQKEGGSLRVAMEDPSNVEAIEFAKRHTGLEIVPLFADREGLKKALNYYKRNIKEDFDKVIADNVKKASLEGNLLQAAERLPVIKVLDTILEYAVAERASDIHIETEEENVIVRFRVDGILKDIIKLPRGIEEALVARINILSNLKLDERRIPQDGRYKFDIDADVVSLRISIIPGFYGENVVMRLLHESARPLSLDELGIIDRNLDIIRSNITRPHGMILVTGPTGSGKTTTLYSVLNILNTVKVKIATIEDPIEYGIQRITQIQVHPKAGLEFATGLRALLRHDPDIIMVGEIRDGETAEIAVHAALTGHLVLSTLHTNDAPGTIPRILDMGVEPYLAASTINAVIAQRLVRRLKPEYAREYKPDATLIKQLKTDYNVDVSKMKFYSAKETTKGESAFSGRIGIYETLSVTERIRALINRKSSSDEIRKVAIEEGMITIAQDGIKKASMAMTTLEEV